MRDFKGNDKPVRVRVNRRKRQKKSIDLRRILHRSLRVGVTLFSVVMVAIGSFFMVQMLLASDQFRIDTITVQGNSRLDDETVVALSDVQSGVTTFSLDLDLIGRKIEENPWIHHARIQRIFPRQVVISVVEREPVAIVNLGYLYYLDADGDVFKVLGVEDQLDFPIVTGFSAEQLSQKDPRDKARLKKIVSLLQELTQREQFCLEQVSEMHLEPGGGLSVYSLEGVRIRLGHGDYAKKLDRLERIYSRLQPRIQMLDYIDLNVDNKVIVRIERSHKATKI